MTDAILLTPGVPYRADLVGGPLDGTTQHPSAVSPVPLSELFIAADASSEVLVYVWNHGLVEAGGVISARYVFRPRTS